MEKFAVVVSGCMGSPEQGEAFVNRMFVIGSSKFSTRHAAEAHAQECAEWNGQFEDQRATAFSVVKHVPSKGWKVMSRREVIDFATWGEEEEEEVE